MRTFPWIALLVALAAGSACSAGSAGSNPGGSPTPTPTPDGTPTPSALSYGGYLSAGTLRVEEPQTGSPVTHAFAAAAFVVPTPVGPVTLPSLGSCQVTLPGPTPTPAAPIPSRDAGPAVSLSGAASIDLPELDTSAGVIVYEASAALPLSSIVEGGSYDLAWAGTAGGMTSGSVSGALSIPPQLLVTQPDLSQVVTLSGALSVSWTGTGVAPAWLFLTVTDSQTHAATSAFCQVPDSGSFTVPTSVISQMPSGTGSLGMYRRLDAQPSLGDGSALYVSGVQEHFGQVTKP